MSTDDNKRLYYSSMVALAYVQNDYAMSLSDFPEHHIMLINLTSTQEITHDFIHLELTNSILSVKVKIDDELPNNIKNIFLGKICSTVYIDSARNVP